MSYLFIFRPAWPNLTQTKINIILSYSMNLPVFGCHRNFPKKTFLWLYHHPSKLPSLFFFQSQWSLSSWLEFQSTECSWYQHYLSIDFWIFVTYFQVIFKKLINFLVYSWFLILWATVAVIDEPALTGQHWSYPNSPYNLF